MWGNENRRNTTVNYGLAETAKLTCISLLCSLTRDCIPLNVSFRFECVPFICMRSSSMDLGRVVKRVAILESYFQFWCGGLSSSIVIDWHWWSFVLRYSNIPWMWLGAIHSGKNPTLCRLPPNNPRENDTSARSHYKLWALIYHSRHLPIVKLLS